MSKEIAELEKHLGVNEGFFDNLQLEDDWSLIVKLHSLLESACTSLLAEELGRPEIYEEIYDAFSQIQMGNSKNGKLAFIKALDLLSVREQKYLETLGWLRNKFVHNIKNTRRTLVEFMASLSSKRKKECAKILHLKIEVATIQGREYTGPEFVTQYPAKAIWLSSMMVLEMIRRRIIMGQKRQELVAQKIADHLSDYGPIILRDTEVQLKTFNSTTDIVS